MSYCRFSSDNWRSDVYCYENVSGAWTTHVAGSRVVGDIPREPDLADLVNNKISPEEFANLHNVVMEWLANAKHVDIELPCAGESFDDDGPEGMLARLTTLQTIGYHVPIYVFEELRSEIAALDNAKP